MSREKGCAFCLIVDRRAPAKIVQDTRTSLIIEPLNPVTPGHVLVIPKFHVRDFTESPIWSGLAMEEAARFAAFGEESYNLITSKGRLATQSIFHLHIHLVPRREDDGLNLPWTEQ